VTPSHYYFDLILLSRLVHISIQLRVSSFLCFSICITGSVRSLSCSISYQYLCLCVEQFYMIVIAVSSIFHRYFIGLLHHHRSAALSPHDSLPYSTLPYPPCPTIPYHTLTSYPSDCYVLPHLLSCPILCILTSLPILSSRFTHHPSLSSVRCLGVGGEGAEAVPGDHGL
jgi:hypothetical protein